MATLLGQQRVDAEVVFRAFGFQESDDNAMPVPYPDGYEWGVFLQPHVRRFGLFSAGHAHTAAVIARIWDGDRVTRAEGAAYGVERYTIDFWPKTT